MIRQPDVAAMAVSDRPRWLALTALCLGVLMIAIDTTIVNVALPSIGIDLHFSQASLVWVVNAYLVTYGGFLILGGRLGDVFGHRRMFLLGITFFTLASLVCGLATSPGLLVTARAVQGVAGAAVSAVTLSLTTSLFTDVPKQAKAFGARAFVGAGGNGIGLLLGGMLTHVLGWHCIFFVNIPVGAGVYALCLALIPPDPGRTTRGYLDIAGALTVTSSLMLAIYAIVNGNQAGWSSTQTLLLLSSAGALLTLFIGIEARAKRPLIPLRLFQTRHLVAANTAGALLWAAVFSWQFGCSLYLQVVRGFNPLQVGLAFLPANLVTAVISICLVPGFVVRFGIRRTFVVAMLLCGVGLSFFARAPLRGSAVFNVLPGMLLMGLGNGMAYNPLLLGALNGVAPKDVGVASGVVSTSCVMGSALGLAVFASIAAARTDGLFASGVSAPFAFNSGYHVAFVAAAVFACIGALIGGVFFRVEPH